ncbi:MAG: GlsB/YeaQ/YmgE family stress response membrane protein [Rhizobiales bacterium]|nr:GlsB/YeaQ/YmgE family stress response membrane protein [Hyphomicrobiales bacterium]
MDVNGVGWIVAIVVGGIAGWLAEMVMKSNMGVLMNIVLGIVGAVVLNAILAALNFQSFGVGWVAYLITGFIGACLLIFIGRLIKR